MATVQEVYDFIMQYINNIDKNYTSWYVGIASSPRNSLFTEHNVSEQHGHWIYKNVDSEDTARAVKKYIIENHNTKGDTEGGDNTTTSVYAFHITGSTKE
jgi:predicted secreted protein